MYKSYDAIKFVLNISVTIYILKIYCYLLLMFKISYCKFFLLYIGSYV
jgi:hypothetical protein